MRVVDVTPEEVESVSTQTAGRANRSGDQSSTESEVTLPAREDVPEKYRPLMEKVESIMHDLKVCDRYTIHEDQHTGETDITPRVTLMLIKEFKRASGSEV